MKMEKITKEEFLKRSCEAEAISNQEKRIAKKINDRAQEEMAQELERLRQLDPSRKLSLRIHE